MSGAIRTKVQGEPNAFFLSVDTAVRGLRTGPNSSRIGVYAFHRLRTRKRRRRFAARPAIWCHRWHGDGTGTFQVARDHNCETLVWAQLQSLLYGLTPKIEAVALGLLFTDLDSKAVAP